MFEQNRLTQKIVDGRRRKNVNSGDQYRQNNHTPSYMIQPNAFFSDTSASHMRSPPQDGLVFLSNRVSADNSHDVTPGMPAEESNQTSATQARLLKPIIPPNSAKLFEHHTYQRDRYMDNYYNRLDKHAKSIDRTE